jgi:hypothetical protein
VNVLKALLERIDKFMNDEFYFEAYSFIIEHGKSKSPTGASRDDTLTLRLMMHNDAYDTTITMHLDPVEFKLKWLGISPLSEKGAELMQPKIKSLLQKLRTVATWQ